MIWQKNTLNEGFMFIQRKLVHFIDFVGNNVYKLAIDLVLMWENIDGIGQKWIIKMFFKVLEINRTHEGFFWLNR